MEDSSQPMTARRRWIACGILCAWGVVMQVVLRSSTAEEMTGAARLAAWGISWLMLGSGLAVGTHGTPLFRPVGGAALVAALGGFGVMVNGLAFGPGPVECTRTISFVLVSAFGEAGDLECRVVAGALLAVPYDSVAVAVLLLLPALGMRDGPVPKALRKLAGVCVFVGFFVYLVMIALAVLVVDRREGWDRMVRGFKKELASLRS